MHPGGPPNVAGEPIHSYMLRSWVDKSTFAVAHQLYVSDYYEGEGLRLSNRAMNSDANSLEFTNDLKERWSLIHGGFP